MAEKEKRTLTISTRVSAAELEQMKSRLDERNRAAGSGSGITLSEFIRERVLRSDASLELKKMGRMLAAITVQMNNIESYLACRDGEYNRSFMEELLNDLKEQIVELNRKWEKVYGGNST